MSRYRVCLLSASLSGAVWFSGCAMMNGGPSWLTGKNSDQSEPEIEAVEDKWSFVGKEGRGGRVADKTDWLDRVLWSDKARDINRNLGFE